MVNTLKIILFLTLATVVPVQAGRYDHWNDGELNVVFIGQGLESGQVLQLEIENTGKTEKEFYIPRLTVLEPKSAEYSPVLVESQGAWKIKPGGTLKFKVGGYSLDRSRKMPSAQQSLLYRPTAGGKRYQKAQVALQKSLEVEGTSGFKAPILPADKHRALVIQRVIWRVHGGNNPKTAKALHADLASAFKNRPKAPSDQVVKAVAASIWRDVEQVYKSLAGS